MKEVIFELKHGTTD